MDNLRIENVERLPIRNDEKVTQKDSIGFGKMIKGAINRVNRFDREADKSIVDLLQAKTGVHETMIALQKADVSMRLLLTVRNKVLEAYREIMHMNF